MTGIINHGRKKRSPQQNDGDKITGNYRNVAYYGYGTPNGIVNRRKTGFQKRSPQQTGIINNGGYGGYGSQIGIVNNGGYGGHRGYYGSQTGIVNNGGFGGYYGHQTGIINGR